MFDEAEADRDGRLVVHCKDVPEELADLARPECLRAVLRHLEDFTGVRGVVLVHDRERVYGRRATAIVAGLVALAELLERFAQRSPAPDFPGFTAKEVAAVCARCEFRPVTLFARLRDRLLGDPLEFLVIMNNLAASLAAYEEAGCTACTAATIQDLKIILNEMSRLPEA